MNYIIVIYIYIFFYKQFIHAFLKLAAHDPYSPYTQEDQPTPPSAGSVATKTPIPQNGELLTKIIMQVRANYFILYFVDCIY